MIKSLGCRNNNQGSLVLRIKDSMYHYTKRRKNKKVEIL